MTNLKINPCKKIKSKNKAHHLTKNRLNPAGIVYSYSSFFHAFRKDSGFIAGDTSPEMEYSGFIGITEQIAEEKKEIDIHISFFNNFSTNSAVVSTLTNDCCLRCVSLDQIAELMDNANAMYGESFMSCKEFAALTRKFSYLGDLKSLINSQISLYLISNSCSESFDLNRHNSLYFLSSDFMNSGAKNSTLIEKNKYEATEKGFISENKILLSNTSIIFVYPEDLDFIIANNSSLILGDTLESNLLKESFLAFLPNSTDHLTNSLSLGEFNLVNNSCLNISCLASSDQFTQTNSFSSVLTLFGIVNVTDGIYSSPLFLNSSNFFNSASLLSMPCFNTSFQLTSGNFFLSSSNSFGNDNVMVAILVPPTNSVYIHKSVGIYKSFDFNENNLIFGGENE